MTKLSSIKFNLLGNIITGIKWWVLEDSAIFLPVKNFTSHKKTRRLRLWGSKGVVIIIFYLKSHMCQRRLLKQWMEGCNFIGGCYHNFVIKITIWLQKSDFRVDRDSHFSCPPSGGQEIKLRLTFRAVAPLADKMKVLLRQQYNFEFDGQQQGDINNDNGGDISDNENENTL